MVNNKQGVNSLSVVGRLSTLQSVHYQRFHCIIYSLVVCSVLQQYFCFARKKTCPKIVSVFVVVQDEECDACKDVTEFLQTYLDNEATEVSRRK